MRANGIPYARADRFALPSPTPPWVEPLPATEPAPACPQPPVEFLDEVLGGFSSVSGHDEHCQRLSVTMPGDVRPGEALPVMVWVHGGSYVFGAGDVGCMDPAPLVREQRVVVVTVTYRLGLFGFLGDGVSRPANLGLFDLLEALRWVQRNIAAFGGDPGNVTAFGQSAGADAIAHLMATRESRGLFRRVILQSPPLGIRRGRARMNAAMMRVASSLTAQTPVAQVVRLTGPVLRVGSRFGLKGAMSFGPQAGHAPLPAEAQVEAAWDAVAPHVDVLIGYARDEAELFLQRPGPLRAVFDRPRVGPWLSARIRNRTTEAVYGRACREFAARHARAGGNAWSYLITWAAPGNPFGAAHTIDLPLLFGDEATWRDATLVAGATWEELQAAARPVRALWADFARGTTPADSTQIPDTLTCTRA
nr:carboxylesterase family protein [Kineosphaera limosa]